MKKIALFILFASFLSSCDQNAKSSAELNSNAPKEKQANADAVKASPEHFKILLENEYVRVVEYSLKPGEKDDWHTHPAKSSYVVSGGKLKINLENGEKIIADEKTGTASWMDYVGKHYVENIGDSTVTIVLTEIKSLDKKQ